jgi:hypothetical protein
MATKHSTIVGGSTAGRLLACPGSYQATLALPPSAEISSEYAEEGTFAHACMDVLMKHRMAHGSYTRVADVDKLLGMFIHDREVTQAHTDDMILPALIALTELEAIYGDGFKVLAVELRVRFPDIPAAFGTMDLVLGNKDTVLHVDWKFGQGVPVKAVYTDPAGDVVNPQLLFYNAASKHSARHLYRGRPNLVAAIIQPRTDEPLTHTIVTPKELKWFREDLVNAVTKAIDYDPPRHKGEHCRWAPCKATCPLWTAPLLEMVQLPGRETFDVSTSAEVTPYGEYLAKAKVLADMAAQFKKEIDEQLHSYLEAGGVVPGWRLKAKVKQRQWVDEGTVLSELQALGFEFGDICGYKLKTFAETDKTAKKLGVKIPDHLRVAPPTNETTVTTTDDPAPVVMKPLAIEQFRAALAAVTTAKAGGR